VRNDFGLEYVSQLPARGSKSEGLRIAKESWTSSTASFVMSGLSGNAYEVRTGGDAHVQSVENAELIPGEHLLRVSFPDDPVGKFQTKTVTVHLQTK
jgi:hypothetical protein